MIDQSEGQKRTAEAINRLLQRKAAHLELGQRMFKADGGNLFCMDLLATAVLNRSIRLVQGFADQIRTNFLCAAPLVRLQLDNLLRFNGARFVDSLNDFVIEILRGTPIRKIKDRTGQFMNDAYLLKKAAAEYPELEAIYERGCGYIHLCELHMLHTAQVTGDMEIELSVALEDDEIKDEHRVSAIDAMIRVTDLVLNVVAGWVATKSDPELVRKPIKRAEQLLERGHVSLAKEWLRRVIAEHPVDSVVAEAEAKLSTIP